MRHRWFLGALLALSLPAAAARADRLSFEVGAGAGTFFEDGDDAPAGVAISVGVGLATSRRFAIDLRYARVQDLSGEGSPERFFFLGLAAHRQLNERLFVGVGLGMGGAGGAGPALDARVGAVLAPTRGGYLFAALDGCAAAVLDGDTDPATAALLLVGYRAR